MSASRVYQTTIIAYTKSATVPTNDPLGAVQPDLSPSVTHPGGCPTGTYRGLEPFQPFYRTGQAIDCLIYLIEMCDLDCRNMYRILETIHQGLDAMPEMDLIFHFSAQIPSTYINTTTGILKMNFGRFRYTIGFLGPDRGTDHLILDGVITIHENDLFSVDAQTPKTVAPIMSGHYPFLHNVVTAIKRDWTKQYLRRRLPRAYFSDDQIDQIEDRIYHITYDLQGYLGATYQEVARLIEDPNPPPSILGKRLPDQAIWRYSTQQSMPGMPDFEEGTCARAQLSEPLSHFLEDCYWDPNLRYESFAVAIPELSSDQSILNPGRGTVNHVSDTLQRSEMFCGIAGLIPRAPDQELKVLLDPNSDEYQSIAHSLQDDLGATEIVIHKIHHPVYAERAERKKRLMCSLIPNSPVVTQFMFVGTGIVAPDTILHGSGGIPFGCRDPNPDLSWGGIALSESAVYADDRSYRFLDPASIVERRQILVAQLTHVSGPPDYLLAPQPSRTTAPLREQVNHLGVGYDVAIGRYFELDRDCSRIKEADVYITWHRDQVMPAYLVQYRVPA